MSSPDDPVFWLHHSNVDRLFTMWQDCHDYELITTPGPNQYTPSNPNPPNGNPKQEPNTKIPFDVGIDTPMSYWFQTPTSLKYQDTFQFPQSKWPTPRDMLTTGTATEPGYDGTYYVYGGPDNLVNLMQTTLPACSSNTAWRLVNQNIKKRDIETNQNEKNPYDNNHEEMVFNAISYKWKELSKGRENDIEAIWKDLLDWDCRSSPSVTVDDNFYFWLKMNGLRPEQFDKPCDSVSERFYTLFGKNALVDSETVKEESKGVFLNMPLVVVGSVVGVIVLIGTVVGVGCYVQKTIAKITDVDSVQGYYNRM